MDGTTLPGFTAEASAYQTSYQYRLAAGRGSLGDGNMIVVPQSCGIFQGVFCGTVIVAGSAACTAFCLSGPAPCAGCWVTALGAFYSACKDCIPGWMRALIDQFEHGTGTGGGGGAGSTGCCPRGMKCCGSCNNPSKKCDDVCVLRSQSCP